MSYRELVLLFAFKQEIHWKLNRSLELLQNQLWDPIYNRLLDKCSPLNLKKAIYSDVHPTSYIYIYLIQNHLTFLNPPPHIFMQLSILPHDFHQSFFCLSRSSKYAIESFLSTKFLKELLGRVFSWLSSTSSILSREHCDVWQSWYLLNTTLLRSSIRRLSTIMTSLIHVVRCLQ